MTDLGLLNMGQDDIVIQMEEVARIELERAEREIQSRVIQKPKSKGIKLKKSLEKFKNRLFQTHSSLKNKDKLNEDILKNIDDSHVISRSPTINSAILTDSHSSSSELGEVVPSGYVPDLDEILDLDFHCRRIGLENFYLNEQNNALINEIRLAQESLVSLRKVLNHKVAQIERLHSTLK